MKNLIFLFTLISLTCVVVGQSQGDILITEYMADPTAVGDTEGEYFELYNTTTSPIDIGGWIVKDDGSDSFTISGPLIIPAKDFIVIGKGDGAYNNHHYEMTGMSLANGADEIVLINDGTEICRINYNDGDQFEPASCELNDISNHTHGITQESDYIAATDALSGNDKGSPGFAGNTGGTSTGTPDPEPSNHVSNFIAQTNGHDQIDLSWVDNDGAQAADGFLIKANTSGTFTDPSDTSDPFEDIDLSDGSAVVKVGHSIESYAFTGLYSNTNYYFKIWPYTNSGSNIDFKTDGTVPANNATTDEFPSAPFTLDFEKEDVYSTSIDEFSDGSDDYFIRTDGSNISTTNIDNISGNFYFGAQDIDGEQATLPVYLTINNININGHDDLVFMINLAEDDDGSNQYWDDEDHVIIKYRIDGDGADAYTDIFEISGTGTNTEPLINTNPPTAITNSFTRFTKDIAGTGLTLDIQIEYDLDAGEEDIAIDNISIASGRVWDGGAAGNSAWNNANNWSPNVLPTAIDNVVIPDGNDVVITSDTQADCNDLTIEGSATLTIQSDAFGTGSLIVNGTATGNATVERYLPDGAWHLISPSTSGVTVNDFYFDNNPSTWITYHTESTNEYTYLTDLSEALNVGQGYSIWVDASKYNITATMNGNIQTADLSTALNYSGTANDQGWNLIGNPFTSAIDWDLISAGNTTGAVYVWDEDYDSDGEYLSRSGGVGSLAGGIVPPAQGFFVKATSEGGFTIPKSATTHNEKELYKRSNVSERYVNLTLQHEEYKSEVFIGFPEYGTSSQDVPGDAHYLISNLESPSMYVIEEGIKLSVNSHAPLSAEPAQSVPVHVTQVLDGEYTITLEDSDYFNDVAIVLEDLKVGNMHEFMIDDDTYNFTGELGDDENRFILHFDKLSLNNETANNNEEISIYNVDKKIYISSVSESPIGNIALYNTLGQLINTHNTNTSSETIHVQKSGIYIIKIDSNKSRFVKKIIIQ